jgi:hypothetical protein
LLPDARTPQVLAAADKVFEARKSCRKAGALKTLIKEEAVKKHPLRSAYALLRYDRPAIKQALRLDWKQPLSEELVSALMSIASGADISVRLAQGHLGLHMDCDSLEDLVYHNVLAQNPKAYPYNEDIERFKEEAMPRLIERNPAFATIHEEIDDFADKVGAKRLFCDGRIRDNILLDYPQFTPAMFDESARLLEEYNKRQKF